MQNVPSALNMVTADFAETLVPVAKLHIATSNDLRGLINDICFCKKFVAFVLLGCYTA
jgi:hypothetical protein